MAFKSLVLPASTEESEARWRQRHRERQREREIERETEREFFVLTICGAIVDTDNFIGCSTPPHDCSHSLHKGSDAANFVEHRDDDGN
jgi:hypothetical protein